MDWTFHTDTVAARAPVPGPIAQLPERGLLRGRVPPDASLATYRRFPGQALSRHTFEPFGQRRILATLFNRFGEASVEKSDETEARGKEFPPNRTSLQSLVQSIIPEVIAPGTHDRTTLTRKQGSRRS